MTLTEPEPALNPVRIEHRLTVVEEKLEQRLFSIAEQLGNLVAQMKIANGRTGKNEDAIRVESSRRVAELAVVQDKVDQLAQGILDRAAMEAATKAAYTAGQQSITVKMPWRQFAAGVGLIATLIGVVETGARVLL